MLDRVKIGFSAVELVIAALLSFIFRLSGFPRLCCPLCVHDRRIGFGFGLDMLVMSFLVGYNSTCCNCFGWLSLVTFVLDWISFVSIIGLRLRVAGMMPFKMGKKSILR